MKTAVLWLLLAFVVVGHTLVVIGNVAAFFVLPLTQPWPIALPLASFILIVSTSKTLVCPLTALENRIRVALGLKEIHGFVGFYMIRPCRRLLGRCQSAETAPELSAA